MASPVSLAQIDPVFEQRLKDLQTHATAEGAARPVGNQVPWARPADWEGDVFDFAAFAKSFDTTAATQDYLKANKTPTTPGTVSDVIAATTMIDYMVTMERAFKVRHTMRRPRAMAHAAARAVGHGDSNGPLAQLGLEYVRAVLAKGKTTT